MSAIQQHRLITVCGAFAPVAIVIHKAMTTAYERRDAQKFCGGINFARTVYFSEAVHSGLSTFTIDGGREKRYQSGPLNGVNILPEILISCQCARIFALKELLCTGHPASTN